MAYLSCCSAKKVALALSTEPKVIDTFYRNPTKAAYSKQAGCVYALTSCHRTVRRYKATKFPAQWDLNRVNRYSQMEPGMLTIPFFNFFFMGTIVDNNYGKFICINI